MTKQETISFLKKNEKRMSYESFSEETGLSCDYLYNLCSQEGIKPISQFKEMIIFIKEWKGQMSREKILKVLGIDYQTFARICYKANITLKDFPTEFELQARKVSGLSVRKIFSEYQRVSANHYQHG